MKQQEERQAIDHEEYNRDIAIKHMARQYSESVSNGHDYRDLECGFKAGYRQALSELRKPVKTNDTPDFLKAVKNQRNTFCAAINRQEWNTELRTKAEDLLIMYDQLIERLQPSEPWPPKPEGTIHATISGQPSERISIGNPLEALKKDIARIHQLDDKLINIAPKKWMISSLMDGYVLGLNDSESSEDSGQPELVEKIFNIIDCNSCWNGKLQIQIVTQDSIRSASKEIAALFPSSRSQKDRFNNTTCECCVNKDFNDMGCKNYLQDFKCKNLNI